MIEYEWVIEEFQPGKNGSWNRTKFDRKKNLSQYRMSDIQSLDHKHCTLAIIRLDFDYRGVPSEEAVCVEIVDGEMVLPEKFSSGKRIPKGFRKELKKLHSNLMESVI